MPKLSRRIGRAAKRVVKQVESRVHELVGRKAVRSNVVRMKAVALKALEAAAVAGAVAATTMVIRERSKRRALA